MARTRILMALAAMLIIWPTMMGADGGCGGSGGVTLEGQESSVLSEQAATIGDSAVAPAPPEAAAVADDVARAEGDVGEDAPKLLCGDDEASGEPFKCFSCTAYLPASAPAVEAVMTANVAPIEEALGELASTARLDPLRLGFYENKTMRAQVGAICGACALKAPAAMRLFDRALDLLGPREAVAMMSREGRIFSYARMCSDFVVLYRTSVDIEKALQQLGVKVISESVDEDGSKVFDVGNMMVKREGAFIVAGAGKMFWEAIANIRMPPASCPFAAAQKQLGLSPKTALFIGATAESMKLGYRHEVAEKAFAAMKVSEIMAGVTKFASSFAGALDAGEMPRLALAVAGKTGEDVLRLVVEGTYELLRAAASAAAGATESLSSVTKAAPENFAAPEQETSSTATYEKSPIEYNRAPASEYNTAPAMEYKATAPAVEYNTAPVMVGPAGK